MDVIMKIDLQDIRDSEKMRQFHDFIGAARRHIEAGGTVIVLDNGRRKGVASTLDELEELVP